MADTAVLLFEVILTEVLLLGPEDLKTNVSSAKRVLSGLADNRTAVYDSKPSKLDTEEGMHKQTCSLMKCSKHLLHMLCCSETMCKTPGFDDCVLKQKDPSLDSPNAEIFPEQLTDSMSTLMLLVPLAEKKFLRRPPTGI